LLTLLMLLMMRVATSLGVHRGLLSWVLSKVICLFNLFPVLVNLIMLIFWIFFQPDMVTCQLTIFYGGNVRNHQTMLLHVWLWSRSSRLTPTFILSLKCLLPFGEKLINKYDNVAIFYEIVFLFQAYVYQL